MLLLPDVHLSLFKLPPLLTTSCPQLPPVRPISPSILPTSLPQAYPALNEIAENTSRTPAEIIQAVSVELIVSSLVGVVFIDFIFFACRSLLDSRDFRLAALGDLVLGLSISDSGTNRKAVGCAVCLDVGWRSCVFSSFGLTAAAQERRVVREARSAAS